MPEELTQDPEKSAAAAGLHYVCDNQPGIQRRRCGKGFSYSDPAGNRIADPEERQRIESLAIPPAYTDVWICPDPNGHLQATGRDAKGRKQYRYHPRWREVRDETKFNRMIAFGTALPMIRQRASQDLARRGLPREKVLATVIRLLELTLIRVGNQEYARDNNSYGLTTLRDRHVKVSGSTIKFQFRGKSGVKHALRLQDRRLAKIVKRCQDIPGYELFQYLDDDGNRQTIDSSDVNAYLQAITGECFTAKDFRTWTATVLALTTLQQCDPCTSETAGKKTISQMIKTVSQELGNTPTVCRKYYVHPAVVEAYLKGNLLEVLEQQLPAERQQLLADLQQEEIPVMQLLLHHQQTNTSQG